MLTACKEEFLFDEPEIVKLWDIEDLLDPLFDDLLAEEPEDVDFFEDEPLTNDLVGEEPEAEELFGEEPLADDLVGEEPEADDLVGEEPEADDLVGEEPEADDLVGEEPEADDLVGEEPEVDDFLFEVPEAVEPPDEVFLVDEPEVDDLLLDKLEEEILFDLKFESCEFELLEEWDEDKSLLDCLTSNLLEDDLELDVLFSNFKHFEKSEFNLYPSSHSLHLLDCGHFLQFSIECFSQEKYCLFSLS